jgi:hypothetical protein
MDSWASEIEARIAQALPKRADFQRLQQTGGVLSHAHL